MSYEMSEDVNEIVGVYGDNVGPAVRQFIVRFMSAIANKTHDPQELVFIKQGITAGIFVSLCSFLPQEQEHIISANETVHVIDAGLFALTVAKLLDSMSDDAVRMYVNAIAAKYLMRKLLSHGSDLAEYFANSQPA